jgi:hypothetical protein
VYKNILLDSKFFIIDLNFINWLYIYNNIFYKKIEKYYKILIKIQLNNNNNKMLNSYYDDETESTVSINSESSNESERNDNDIINNSKYNLIVPELFNKYIHGLNECSDPNINGQFIVIQTFKIRQHTNLKKLFEKIKSECKPINKYYNSFVNRIGNEYICNYDNIIKRDDYIKPEIGKIYYLKGDECVCVLKTFWIKIIQRAWKKIYQNRQKIKRMRYRPDVIFHKQLTGKYKEDCQHLPSIRGMLLH